MQCNGMGIVMPIPHNRALNVTVLAANEICRGSIRLPPTALVNVGLGS